MKHTLSDIQPKEAQVPEIDFPSNPSESGDEEEMKLAYAADEALLVRAVYIRKHRRIKFPT